MRNKYIRFFISSTFADMKVERDLLQEVFNEIIPIYRQKGWQIETVDLRWGISTEAGYHNKTMQICEQELLRCQRLSPKPNFIVLIGNRYGWVPLPERITHGNFEQLKMTDEEYDLFGKWYFFDENALPRGQYLLKPRNDIFREDEIWSEQVAEPLGKMFLRNSKSGNTFINRLFALSQPQSSQEYGISATEQEIRLGALDVEDASEHVIAYFRDLTDIPLDERKVFNEKDGRCVKQLSSLKKKLTDKLGKDNIYAIRLSYEEYKHLHFASTFKKQMKQRITYTIDRVIEECSNEMTNSENKNHLDIAAHETKGFVGREEELRYIDKYLRDPKSSTYSLWIKAPSGAGKSALMARVVESYKDKYHVICRFCGRTLDSSAATSLLRSVWWNLKQLDTGVNCNGVNKYMDFPGHSHKPWECMKCLLSKFSSDKPVLIIIDAINQAEEDTEGFSVLKWLDYLLSPAVRVIISSTDELRYMMTPEHITILPLHNMGTDAWSQVSQQLLMHERRLTAKQVTQVKHIIDQSDHSAIFLDVLGKYLCRITSNDTLEGLPHTLTGLVGHLLGELSLPENHGCLIVRKVMSLLATDRLGLSQTEILDLLALDDEFCTHVKADSHHELVGTGGRTIPPILWSRLQSDLEPLLRQLTTKGGQVLCFYHSELRQAVANIYLTTYKEQVEAIKALYQYYSLQIRNDSPAPHALIEVVHCGVKMMNRARNNDTDLFNNTGISIFHLLTDNAPFLIMKSMYYHKSLAEDYLQAMPYFDSEVQKELLYVQRTLIKAASLMEINDIDKLAGKSKLLPSQDNLLCLLKNLPSTMPLRHAVDGMSGAEDIMENSLSDSNADDDDGTLYVVPEIGKSPCMSADGSKIASLFENGHQIRLVDLRAPLSYKFLNAKKQVSDMIFSDDMRYAAIRLEDTIVVYDIVDGKAVFERTFSSEGSFSLSADGVTAMCDSGKMVVINQQGNILCRYEDQLCCRITPSGKYLWLMDNKLFLHRIEIGGESDCIIRQFSLEDFEKTTDKNDDKKGNTTSAQMRIVSCLDNCCAVTSVGCKITCRIILKNADTFNIRFFDCNWLKFFTNGDMVFDKRYFNPYGLYDKEGKDAIGSIDISWKCASPDGSFLLTDPEDGNFARVVDIGRVKQSYNKSTGNNGVNSIACSRDGNKIWAASGFNFSVDFQKFIVRVIDGKNTIWIPPIGKEFQYITQVATSPDGSLLAISTQGYTNSGGCGFMVISLNGDIVIKQNTGTFSAIGIAFSEDSHYLVARTGHLICDVEPLMFLYNNRGDKLYEGGERDDLTTDDFMCFSRNNRYVFGSWLYLDLLKPEEKTNKNNSFNISSALPDGMMAIRHKFFLVQPPVGNGFLSYEKGGNIFFNHLDSSNRSVFHLPAPFQPIACSPSGRYIYLIHNYQLSLWDWLDTQQITPLMDNVQWIVPALDDNHIYAIRQDYMILLMNVRTKRIEQRAFMGRTIYQQACRQGLAVVNDYCEVALLHPDSSLRVNTPAPTTFVRHWNLEQHQLQSPMAVCPACGHHILLSTELAKVLKPAPDSFEKIHKRDWDDPRLHGYSCPHCHSSLNFTPYIL